MMHVSKCAEDVNCAIKIQNIRCLYKWDFYSEHILHRNSRIWALRPGIMDTLNNKIRPLAYCLYIPAYILLDRSYLKTY